MSKGDGGWGSRGDCPHLGGEFSEGLWCGAESGEQKLTLTTGNRHRRKVGPNHQKMGWGARWGVEGN